MKKITVILPIHELDDTMITYIDESITSVYNSDEMVNLLVVYHNDKDKKLFDRVVKLKEGLDVTYVKNTGNTDFSTQVNKGIESCKTEWFSILEVDDAYSKTWFTNVLNYMDHYPNMDVFLPIVADVDDKQKFLNFTNESLWAVGFCNVQGHLDNEVLLEYQNYQISGAVYKTEKVKLNGNLKSYKLSFGYEYLLRLTHNNINIMTIPKIGYKHTNMREKSLFWNYKNNEAQKLTPAEAKFWMETAKKEYFFSEEREITYTNQS